MKKHSVIVLLVLSVVLGASSFAASPQLVGVDHWVDNGNIRFVIQAPSGI